MHTISSRTSASPSTFAGDKTINDCSSSPAQPCQTANGQGNRGKLTETSLQRTIEREKRRQALIAKARSQAQTKFARNHNLDETLESAPPARMVVSYSRRMLNRLKPPPAETKRRADKAKAAAGAAAGSNERTRSTMTETERPSSARILPPVGYRTDMYSPGSSPVSSCASSVCDDDSDLYSVSSSDEDAAFFRECASYYNVHDQYTQEDVTSAMRYRLASYGPGAERQVFPPQHIHSSPSCCHCGSSAGQFAQSSWNYSSPAFSTSNNNRQAVWGEATIPYDHSSGVSALPEASLSVDDLLPHEDDLIDLDELLFPCSIAASVIRGE